MSFVTDDEQIPVKEGKYMKFKIGDNRIRILGAKISGWEGWKTQADGGKKPVRTTENDDIPTDSVDKIEDIKHFWAFPVWNYAAEKVQILKITQSGIKNDILALGKNKKWGDPMDYDLVIMAVGEGKEREYSTQPDPKEPLNAEAQAAWDAVKDKLDMSVYFKNGDPFGDDQQAE